MAHFFRASLVLTLAAACGPGSPAAPTVALTPLAPHTDDALQLSVADPNERPTVMDVEWLRDGEVVADLADLLRVPASRTGRGEAWTARVHLVDDHLRASEVLEVGCTIRDTAPVGRTVRLTPANPDLDDDLVAVAEGDDLDGDSLTWRFSWSRDGVDVPHGADTIPSADTSTGQTWTVTATPFDGELEGAPVQASVRIANTPPQAEAVAITPDRATEETVLKAIPRGQDLDADPITWTHTWTVDGVEVGSGASLDGASFDKGQTVLVRSVPSDGQANGEPVQSDPVVIRNTPPRLASARLSPGTADETTDLVCQGEGWSDIDGDPEELRIAWTVNGRPAGSGATLTGASFDRGDVVGCSVTPFDGEDEGSPVDAGSLTIDNSLPTLSGVSLSTASPRTDATLVARAEGLTDADGDAITLVWAWSVEGSVVRRHIGAETTVSLSGVDHFDKGDRVVVTATPEDASGRGTTVSSATVTVANTPPTAPAVDFRPAVPTEDDDLLCELDADSTDADGDSLTYSMSWMRDGVAWTGSTRTDRHAGDTIDAADTANGEDWYCVAVAGDGDDTSAEATSDELTIGVPDVGLSGGWGVLAGDDWTVCRADASTAWVASEGSGSYNIDDICEHFGYAGADKKGGHCGTVCGYCGTAGLEKYDEMTGTRGCRGDYCGTVQWRCAR